MTSKKSKEKEIKMMYYTTKSPELDNENKALFRASILLESLGHSPGLSSDAFYIELLKSEFPVEDHQSVTLAAIAIETMLSAEMNPDSYEYEEPTIH
tara:strand:+ start:336 stop:626 length:291 start_codon:yes stop_codon:yes gene_type:complete